MGNALLLIWMTFGRKRHQCRLEAPNGHAFNSTDKRGGSNARRNGVQKN
jgi:hypothetical protein